MPKSKINKKPRLLNQCNQADFQKISDNEVIFYLNEKIYPKSVIIAASYLYSDEFYVNIDLPKKGLISVKLKAKKDNYKGDMEILKNRFLNDLLDQILRKQIDSHTARIREYIIANAFWGKSQKTQFIAKKPDNKNSSCEDELDKIIAQIESDKNIDDPLEIAVPWEKKYGKI